MSSKPIYLRCEYLLDPLGVQHPRPRLSWCLPPGIAGIRQQSAYRICVASAEHLLADEAPDLWDSGKVLSSQQNDITYQGLALASRQRCFWQVQLWDADDMPTPVSDVAWWEMGLLDTHDWQAQWIGGANMLRKVCTLASTPRQARVYISGLGYYELYINGRRVGDQLLNPAQTDYEQRLFYVVHDVTGMLNEGDTTLGVLLGEGFFAQSAVLSGKFGWPEQPYGPVRLLLQLEALMPDGSVTTVVSDDSWQACSDGPLVRDTVYGGEVYDATREKPGWITASIWHTLTSAFPDAGDCDSDGRVLADAFPDACDCDSDEYEPVVRAESPGGDLIAQSIEPVRIVRTITPAAVGDMSAGSQVVDLGENIAGVVRLQLNEPRGTTVTIRHAEELNDAGGTGSDKLDMASTGVFATGVEQTDQYTCRGGGESYQPRFTYHGFRFAEISGHTRPLTRNDVTGMVMRTDVRRTGQFRCSDDRLNTLYDMAVRTLEGNLHSVLTDCPARERCGWLGDAQIVAEFAIYTFDMAAFFTKVVGDIITSSDNGHPTMIAPGQRKCGPATPAWGSAMVLLPWYVYLYYGDTRILHQQYDAMVRWAELLSAKADKGIVHEGLGDWCPPGSVNPTATPVGLTSTACLYWNLSLLARIADVCDKSDQARDFARQADEVRRACNDAFFDAAESTYGSQTGNALALHLGLVPDGYEQAVADALAHDVMVTHDTHLSTGILGSRCLFEQLSRYGHTDVAMAVMHQDTYPGFGDLIRQGATTMWETWEKKPADEPFPRSRNHPMQAAFATWMYSSLGGIMPSVSAPGFARVSVRPCFARGMEWAETSYESIRGLLACTWKRQTKTVVTSVTIPPNATADVILPAGSSVTQSPSLIEQHDPAGPVHAVDQSCTPDRVHDHERYRSTVKRLHRTDTRTCRFHVGSGTSWFATPDR